MSVQPEHQRAGPPPQQIAVAVVHHAGRYLVGQRTIEQTLGGQSEFPGGKLLPGEAAEAGAVRECLEETGLEVEVVGRFPPIVQTYPHGTLELHFFRCRVQTDRPPRAPFRWVEREELERLAFPAANQTILAALREG